MEVGQTYEYQVRHHWGGRLWSDWSGLAEEVIDGDLTPPAKAGLPVLTAIERGFQAVWPASTAADYGETEVQHRPAGGGAWSQPTIAAGGFLNQFGLLGNQAYDVRIRHRDRSGNLGAYSDQATVTTLVRTEGLDGMDGLPGEDGVGTEYVFTASSSQSQPPAGSRPLASWTYDQVSFGEIVIGGFRYADGAPSNYSVSREYLHRYRRRAEGFPAPGDPIGTAFSWDGVVDHWGQDGDDGLDGLDGTDGVDGVDGGPGQAGPPGPRIVQVLYSSTGGVIITSDDTDQIGLGVPFSNFDSILVVAGLNDEYNVGAIPVVKIDVSVNPGSGSSSVNLIGGFGAYITRSGTSVYLRLDMSLLVGTFRIHQIIGVDDP